MGKNLLIHAWVVYRFNGEYLLPDVHCIYLEEMSLIFDSVVLLAPIITIEVAQRDQYTSIKCFDNVSVRGIAGGVGFLKSLPYFFHYFFAFINLRKEVDVIYVRFPVPFSWLPKYLMSGKQFIIHFVGDPRETVVNDTRSSWFKRYILSNLFRLEEFLVISAAKNAERVVVNGVTFKDRLERYGINYKSVISTSLKASDIYPLKNEASINSTILYLGYLRSAKSVNTLIYAVDQLSKEFPDIHLDVVGDGSQRDFLQSLVEDRNLDRNVTFYGHINDRLRIKDIANQAALFWFPSLSEGSPRVVIEAMAWGLPVISTPVGSLPYCFDNEIDIMFFDYCDSDSLVEITKSILSDKDKYHMLRANAYSKISSFTIDKFVGDIFGVE